MTEQEISELAMSGKTVHECIVEAFGRGMEAKRVEVVSEIHGLPRYELTNWKSRISAGAGYSDMEIEEMASLQPPKPAVADWAVKAAKAIQATSVENIPDGYEKQILADAAIIEKCFKESQK